MKIRKLEARFPRDFPRLLARRRRVNDERRGINISACFAHPSVPGPHVSSDQSVGTHRDGHGLSRKPSYLSQPFFSAASHSEFNVLALACRSMRKPAVLVQPIGYNVRSILRQGLQTKTQVGVYPRAVTYTPPFRNLDMLG